MIGSFRKVNPFMTTWGMEAYRERTLPFMPEAIRGRAAFVLVNTPSLDPAGRGPLSLLRADADAIARFYPPYWGPVRVAGATAVLRDSAPASIEVPFPAEYRLFAPGALVDDGALRRPGEVVPLEDSVASVEWPIGADVAPQRTVALFTAAAGPPPRAESPKVPIFELL